MKNNGVTISTQSTRNYGVLSTASKSANYFLGDKTDISVSLRTAHGFKKTFNLTEMHDDVAEDIVHGGMVALGLLLFSKNNIGKASGLLLIAALIGFYQNGK